MIAAEVEKRLTQDRGNFRLSDHADAQGSRALEITEKGLRDLVDIATERGDEGWAEVKRLETELAAVREEVLRRKAVPV